MTLKLEAILTAFLLQQTLGFEYETSILSQRITHFENSYVDFNATFMGDEGYPHMILKQPISVYDDLQLMLYIHVYDQKPKLLAKAPLSVCQLLHNKNIISNHTISQFNILQIYNLAGRECPIEPQKLRMYPYIFPVRFHTDIDLGCGFMNVESRLMKCESDEDDEDETSRAKHCDTLMKTVSQVHLSNGECIEPDAIEEEDGWISTLASLGYSFKRFNPF